MTSSWKKYKLKEITTKIGSGATPRGGDSAYILQGVSLIRSQNVLDFSFSREGLAFINDAQAADLKNVALEKDDVLLNITGDSVARVCMVPQNILPARVNQHVSIIRANHEFLNPNFIKYFLLAPSTKDHLLNLASAGATRKALTKLMIEELEIAVPPFHEQKAIAKILSALDDKIELNLQMNKTLEEMANVLYKHWFVDFGPFKNGKFVKSELGMIPEGWEAQRLDNFLNIKRGGSPRPIQEYLVPAGLPWVKISDATASNTPYLLRTQEFIKREGLNKTVLLKAGSLILSNSASPGIPKILNIDACIHDGWLHFPEIRRLDKHILYLLFLRIKESLISQGNGSVFTNLKTDILKSQVVALPPRSVEKEFSSKAGELFALIKSNAIENQDLQATRDYLLPKLISGDMQVKGAHKKIKELV